MKFFDIVLWDTTQQQTDAILAVMWRVAYFVSWDESNGYMTYTFGQQYSNYGKSDIENLLSINGIRFLSVNFN